jgi:ketosteroid isomerase-like protein
VRTSYVFLLVTALVTAESFNKQDAAGIAALYATNGTHVNPAGPRTDIAQLYEGTFKAGFSHEEITVDQAAPVGSDTLVAVGQYRITGKNQSGAPIEIAGIWTSTDVREGGKWKIRMLSAIPKPPQPPKVSGLGQRLGFSPSFSAPPINLEDTTVLVADEDRAFGYAPRDEAKALRRRPLPDDALTIIMRGRQGRSRSGLNACCITWLSLVHST